MRLQLHALAYNLANFLRILALPEAVVADDTARAPGQDRRKDRPHGRSITVQMAKVMVTRGLFEKILCAIAALRPLPAPQR